MVNYKEFENIYSNTVNIETAAFLHLRKNPLSDLICSYTAKIKETLIKQFCMSFPCSMSEAEQHPEFDYTQFFRLLKKYPELVTQSNKQALINLLDDIKSNNVSKIYNLDTIPTIDDFIK